MTRPAHKSSQSPDNMNQPSPATKAAELIRNCTDIRPRWAIVLGSGLSGTGDALEDTVVFPYQSLPGFEPTTIIGHPGRLVLGRLGETSLAAFQGRTHLYEGKGLAPTLAAVRLCRELRIRNMIITNAAGAIRPPLCAGTLMAFTGHLNLTYQTGFGLASTPTMRTGIYDASLREKFLHAARELGAPACAGVYAFLTGPTYETPAETRAYGILGAHAVGMSTVLESMEAARLGMRVLAVSAITNDATPTDPDDSGPTHDAVLAAAKLTSNNLTRIVSEIINRQ